ncbi:PREDICTED: uncharacterized protein LOC109592294 [Amphimedon queenslandica]|uniref:Death domain-containing protein n=2 Tax=Amphimedon queenslandica TaxID=400682 RepID=A0AAN0K2E3_AMPQE|nr:PREDICTED: uncharacterized protein LOC109592294 [Amphimedon queenslandica]|eukprot:XP_019863339.1 PREDICTED: uncharacterized protein LOC109592294 [Amphimedon queenslandica]
MPEKEVTSALNFFHTLKMLFYYHDSPAKDIVSVKLDAVINIIKKLMIKVCKPLDELKDGSDKMAQLATKGYLSIKVIEQNTDDSLKGRENILLGLFKYLKIAALIPTDENDQTDKKDVVFLMPALLPVKNVSDSSTLSKTPLLYYFKEPVPMGLFCAVIVQLLSYPGDEKWGIITKEHNFSNYFNIQKKIINKNRMCKVLLVEQLYCIAIYCEKLHERQSINNCIETAINEVMKDKFIDYEKPITAFYCPCKDKKQHVATVDRNVFIMCSRTGEGQDLSHSHCDEYWSWFMTNDELVEVKRKMHQDNPSSTLEDKELDMSSVTRIFISSAHHYMLIGAGLNVSVSDLKQIPDTATGNLIIVFQRWFETDKNVNWDTIQQLCDDYPNQLGKAKTKLLKYMRQSIPDSASSDTH